MGLCPKPRRGVHALPGPHFTVSGHAPGKMPGACPETVTAAGAEHDVRTETEHQRGGTSVLDSYSPFPFWGGGFSVAPAVATAWADGEPGASHGASAEA